MLKTIKKYIFIDSTLNIKQYEDEFESKRAAINIERCKLAGTALLFFNIILILLDLFFYRNKMNNNNSCLYLYYSHIIVSLLIFLWLVAIRSCRVRRVHRNKMAYYIFINIVLLWCIFERLNSVNYTGQIKVYIICLLGLFLSIYLSPLEIAIMLGTATALYFIGMSLIVTKTESSYSPEFNTFIVMFCSGFASAINYYGFAKNFIYKKTILDKNRELKISNLKLQEYEKLRTDFFANLSHELRTPINVIYSAEQMLNKKLQENNYDIDKTNKYLKMIKQNSHRLIRLINNLIDISKIDATIFEIKPINCDIISIVENITMSVAEYVENRNVSLIFDTEVEEKIIACDPDKIERIILNLLSNAIKFTKKNGEILVNIYIGDENVYISIKDTGIGISEEMQELIFDRFIQVDKSISRNREGSGIGLSLVKSLVELHGGNIIVKSIVGEGSEFIITLPDRVTESEHEENYFNILQDQRIERINIEFSDIYD